MTDDFGVPVESLRGVLKSVVTDRRIGVFQIYEYHTADTIYYQGSYRIIRMNQETPTYFKTSAYTDMEKVAGEIRDRFANEPISIKDLEVIQETPILNNIFKGVFPVAKPGPFGCFFDFDYVPHQYTAMITSVNTKQGVYYRGRIEYAPETDNGRVTERIACTWCYQTMKPIYESFEHLKSENDGIRMGWINLPEHIERFELGAVHEPPAKPPGLINRILGGKKQ